MTRLHELDPDQEGLLIKMSGGEYTTEVEPGVEKKVAVGAAIDFQCDPDKNGLEGLDTETEGVYIEGNQTTQSLQFKSFGTVDDGSYLLKLDWKTRYACDNYLKDRKEGQSGSSGWSFITWIIILYAVLFFVCSAFWRTNESDSRAFLLIAAYLIFGSWLNYNRYGARGWDLLPHGDTIRDIPYLFQGWLKRIINSLQGTGTRGGYSAV